MFKQGHMNTHTNSYARIYTRTHTHSNTHRHTYTLAHTHTHTQIPTCPRDYDSFRCPSFNVVLQNSFVFNVMYMLCIIVYMLH